MTNPFEGSEELPVFARTLGLKVQWVAPDTDHRHDLSAMRAAITQLSRLVYVCNPNNPVTRSPRWSSRNASPRCH